MADTLTKERPSSTVQALNCPNCGGTIALRAAGNTVSIVCEHCGSTLDATRPDLQLIAQADVAMRRPEIALGTRGTLAGVAWEVVGYQERTDGEVAWGEYLLFNPYEGYAFLTDDGRRFSLGRLLAAMPDHSGAGLTLDGREFKHFGTTYPVRVVFVVGEFYWRVAVGETVNETDFVRSGTMLACEESGRERTWTALEMQDWGVAERAFGLEPRVKSYRGTPAPHEPSPYRKAMRDALLIGALALAACLVIAIGTGGSSRILQRQLLIPQDGPPQTAVLGPIEIPSARERVRVRGASFALDNQWLDLDYSLVNRRTQQAYAATAVAETYRGRDSDGAWSEGDPSPDTGFAAIPRGTYDLVVEAKANKWIDPAAPAPVTGIFGTAEPVAPLGDRVPVTVTVDRGGGFAGPFFLALLALLIWPLIAWGRHASFEHRRMAPVMHAGSDDEDDDE
ncbi:MAG: hypothetical protein JWN21_1543 [Sphingomonas bacterium]|uniref:DUF4178 domain-containing protein n=1 Tax=Sphingomonas bacterium TaxID=1895847 RepID=UPI0026128E48|nr:DUF4178 domain-containing protein [Sphingomonas bacterium]MDB5696000.1 hypothetical protein [Sphingomonas bacterium]